MGNQRRKGSHVKTKNIHWWQTWQEGVTGDLHLSRLVRRVEAEINLWRSREGRKCQHWIWESSPSRVNGVLGPEFKSSDSQVVTHSTKACWKFIECRIPSRLEFSNMILYSSGKAACSIFITPWRSSRTPFPNHAPGPTAAGMEGSAQTGTLVLCTIYRFMCRVIFQPQVVFYFL